MWIYYHMPLSHGVFFFFSLDTFLFAPFTVHCVHTLCVYLWYLFSIFFFVAFSPFCFANQIFFFFFQWIVIRFRSLLDWIPQIHLHKQIFMVKFTSLEWVKIINIYTNQRDFNIAFLIIIIISDSRSFVWLVGRFGWLVSLFVIWIVW